MISDPDPLVRLTQADRAAVNGLELGSDVAVSLCVGVSLSAGFPSGWVSRSAWAPAGVAQFVCGALDDAVLVGSGAAAGEFQIAAPHGVAEAATALVVDRPCVELSCGCLAPFCPAVDEAAHVVRAEMDGVTNPLGLMFPPRAARTGGVTASTDRSSRPPTGGGLA